MRDIISLYFGIYLGNFLAAHYDTGKFKIFNDFRILNNSEHDLTMIFLQ